MIQRTKIRQSALLLIYATLQSGETSISRELFWSIAQEKQRGHFIHALAKSILHVARSSTSSFDKLSEGVDRIMRALEGDMVSLRVREALERYYTASQKLESLLAALTLKHTDKRVDDDEALYSDCLVLIQQGGICQAFRADYSQAALDYPSYAREFARMDSVLTRRERVESNVASLKKLKELPAEGEFKGLVQSYNELEALRPEVEALALPALDHREQWDAIIAPRLKHYSMDRLDILDLSILYLSLHELINNELPLPIVISEATALADTYSGSKSAPFIHGILAAAQTPLPEPEPVVEEAREEEIDQEEQDMQDDCDEQDLQDLRAMQEGVAEQTEAVVEEANEDDSTPTTTPTHG